MKKSITFFASLIFLSLGSQAQDGTRLSGTQIMDHNAYTNLPNFIKMEEGKGIEPGNFVQWAVFSLGLPASSTLKPYNTFSDELGYIHTRYRQYEKGYPVEGSMVISHERNGVIKMMNGDYYQNFSSTASPALDEKSALSMAMQTVGAQKYRWENKELEAQMRAMNNDPTFSYYPKGELVFVHRKGASFDVENMRLAYKFDIFAEKPLFRADVFVDASTGEVLESKNKICSANVVGTGVTLYSGTVPMTSDNFSASQYRLRETGRGNGINTYNLANGTTYATTDFTNNSSTWNLAAPDQAAADAHWGAEMTYDYYKIIHNRNSIDGSGYTLNSYMHYSTNYANAFWDGTEMTYGDGNVSQGFLMMTALDVCGHEISHGLTSFTSMLNGGGTDEASALNEGNSDIFGTNIEWVARPTQHDWLMGADITCNTSGVQNHIGIRNMASPKSLNQPNCYLGVNWDPAGECHNNDGPYNYWYYLLCLGGSGTNDIGNTWAVNGITMAEARLIAFRQNTVYFTPTTTYANARSFSIQAATDLYGNCSHEVASTTNAWYAIGVGAAYSGGVPTAGFSVNQTQSCSAPFSVQFTNASSGAVSYSWNFGDGSTGTTASPAHTYTAGGIYNVQLVATGTCSTNNIDTMKKSSLITVNGPPTAVSPTTTVCGPQSFSLSATGVGTITWLDASGNVLGTGPNYVTPTLSVTTSYSVTSSIMTTGTLVAAGAPANNNTLGGGGYLNFTHQLIFDALVPFTLVSVDVYAQGSTGSSPTISLMDNSGNTIATLNANLTSAGLNTVNLNFHVPAGTGYKLAASGANINLYRNNAGAAFPIAVSNVANITGTDVFSTNPTYYYWFYNWKVEADMACPSQPVTVVATIQVCTGISEISDPGILAFPNPTRNQLTIQSDKGISNIYVTNMLGQSVLSTEGGNQKGLTLDVSGLPAGTYFVKIVSSTSSGKLFRIVIE